MARKKGAQGAEESFPALSSAGKAAAKAGAAPSGAWAQRRRTQGDAVSHCALQSDALHQRKRERERGLGTREESICETSLVIVVRLRVLLERMMQRKEIEYVCLRECVCVCVCVYKERERLWEEGKKEETLFLLFLLLSFFPSLSHSLLPPLESRRWRCDAIVSCAFACAVSLCIVPLWRPLWADSVLHAHSVLSAGRTMTHTKHQSSLPGAPLRPRTAFLSD